MLSGSQAPFLYALSILVVFLCLAALYESWSIPLSVMLVMPLGVVGAVLAATLRGFYNDVYFQVGLLTTIGLSAKNAILIVQFADVAETRGADAAEAAMAGRAPAAAADPDDLAGLHGRRLPAGDRHRAPARPASTTSAPASIGGMLAATAAGDLLRAAVLRRRAALDPGAAAPAIPTPGRGGGLSVAVNSRTSFPPIYSHSQPVVSGRLSKNISYAYYFATIIDNLLRLN